MAKVEPATLTYMKYSSRKGFTLVEILIVVAIIAILASVALVGLGPVQRTGRDTRRISDLRQVQNGLELYYAKCGFYPGPAQTQPDCVGPGGGQDWASLTAGIVGTTDLGISKIPNDPNTSATYDYNSDGTTYTIGARLENLGAAQLKDDIDGSVGRMDCNDPVYCVSL